MARFRLKRRTQTEEAGGDLVERLVTVRDPTAGASEDYRTLRTSLLYALVDTPPKVVVVTSPSPSEGKSTTCANLAVVLAQADKSTLLLDCDFRKPVIHRIFRLRNFRGVADALAGENALGGEHGLEEIWQEPLANLKVVTVGQIPPNPAELLGSRRFAELVEGVRGSFDYVIIDAPPTQIFSDPMILATQGDGVLLVVDAQKTRKVAVRQAVRNIESVGARVIGTVMNNVKGGSSDYYYDYSR